MVSGIARRRGGRVLCAVTLLLLIAPGIVHTTGVHAASFAVAVTTTADTTDTCATTGVAPCSLRDAVRYATAELATGPVVISVPAGNYQQNGWNQCTAPPTGTGPFVIARGATGVVNPVYVVGAGTGVTIIHGAGVGNTHYSVFENGSADVTMTNLTITDGSADNCSPASGGAIRDNQGNLTLANVVITGNTASHGGGLAISGAATILNTQITNNRACDGGGIVISGGDFTVANTLIAGNHQGAAAGDPPGFCLGSAGGGGGGMAIGLGTLQLRGSTIENNSSVYANARINEHSPGGIGVSDDTLMITNSTITGNTSGDGAGGIDGHGTMTVENSTITGNTGLAGFPQAINRTTGTASTMTVARTIIQGGGPLCSGVTASGGYNIASDATCSLTQPTDHPSLDPQLGAFGDHGGPTPTYALGVGSPALDAIPAGSCPTNTDQRGVFRPQGGVCDIGSFESGGTPPTLTALSPPSGGTAGGSKVTLIGTGYAPGATATFGTTTAPSMTYVDGTTIRAVAPPGNFGFADVTVTIPGVGVALLPRDYFYGTVNPLPAPPRPSAPVSSTTPPPAPLPRPEPTMVATPNPSPSSRARNGGGAGITPADAPTGTPVIMPAPLPPRR